jgi:hypothetical protein
MIPASGLPAGCTPQVGRDRQVAGLRSRRPVAHEVGTIAYYPVIANPDPARLSVEFTQGQQPNTPGGATTEFYVSQCPA